MILKKLSRLLYLGIALFPLLSCQPHEAASPGNQGAAHRENERGHNHLAQGSEADRGQDIPPIPPPLRAVGVSVVGQKWQLSRSGIRICAQNRPELAKVMVALDMNGYSAPEERLMLRTWIEETLRLAGVHTNPCAEHLFCSWVDAKEAAVALKIVADFLNAPDKSSFPQARDQAILSAEELMQRSAIFRLSALAERISTGSLDGSTLGVLPLKTVERYLGEQSIASFSAVGLASRLRTLSSQLRVEVRAPHGAQTLAQGLLQDMNQASPGTPRKMPVASVKFGTVEVVDTRFVESSLYLAWLGLGPAQAPAIITMLHELATQLRQDEPSIDVTVHEGDGLSARPALMVTAPHDWLIKVAPELSKRGEALFAAHSSRVDVSQSRTARAGSCAEMPQAQGVQVKGAGTAQRIIWVGSAPREVSESF